MANASKKRKLQRLTHVAENGSARMVDVSRKAPTAREAVATGHIQLKPATLKLIAENRASKGDVLAAARIAGIQAAKRTWELVPLCHPLALSAVNIEINFEPPDAIKIRSVVRLTDRTGAEMEALMAVSIAALTIYDMCKAVDRGVVIGPIQLERKSGGKSGRWTRNPAS